MFNNQYSMLSIHCPSELLNVEECDACLPAGRQQAIIDVHDAWYIINSIELYKRWNFKKERVSPFISSVSPFGVQAEQ
jgi:hypothetical protein